MIFDTLTRLFERFGGGAYNPIEVGIEFALIGLAINWCASVLHGTRGTRLLRGLLIMLVVATLGVRVVAAQLNWERLAILYNYSMTGLAFIALVAFQPELRRALIRAGDVSFLRRRAPQDRNIAALVEAAGYLSRNRFGALIAIQRGVGLGSWAEHGTQLHAEVSADLLKSIFYPNSALHDLGVIIRDSRIVAAGCQFPQAESGDLEPSLGSRHRAAVGLSAESDALVLVVSEETGTVSLADRGQLLRFLALDELEQELEARLAGHAGSMVRARGGRRRSDFWRLARRLLAVVPLTLVVWFVIDQASQVVVDNIPIAVRVAPAPGLSVDAIEPSPLRFSLSLRGPRREVEGLRARAANEPLSDTWNLPSLYAAAPDPYVLGEAELLDVLGDLREIRRRSLLVERVAPASLSFKVDEIVSIEMPVRVDSGAVRVIDPRAEPATVLVRMRTRDLHRLLDNQRYVVARTGPRLENAARGAALTLEDVPLDLTIGASSAISALQLEPASVTVKLGVAAQRKQRKLSGIRVGLLKSPAVESHYLIEPVDANEWIIELEVEGDERQVNTLETDSIQAFVNFTSDPGAAASETRAAAIVFEPPEGISVVGPPRFVEVRIVPRDIVKP